ncbi:MAG: DUF4301 family protein [Bacteroidales bacterium]|nr:DUF4301 family protein [Bacteroidales bacterium]
MKFSDQDLQQFEKKGINVEQIERQMENFRNGFPHIKLVRAATLHNGIRHVSKSEIEKYKNIYHESKDLKRLKFVPASGAATRMFKALFEFESAYSMSDYDPSIIENEAYRQVKTFFENLKLFAFYPRLKQVLDNSGKDIEKLLISNQFNEILDALLDKNGMNYRNLPKGLILFHHYPDHNRTSVEEHLAEGAAYAKNSDNSVVIHFTVSPEHMSAFRQLLDEVKIKFEKELNVRYYLSYSVQKSSTDTIAVDKENAVFRDTDGTVLFRPAGHGALLENLNDLDSDIIFIKNIDNVVPDKIREETVLYKQVLAGILIEYQEKIHDYIKQIEEQTVDKALIKEIWQFIEKELCVIFPDKKFTLEEQRKLCFIKLNRPVRICGMVKNSGEPGGGPFWAENPDGTVSLQIVETTQIDLKNMLQRTILESSTHFNPVDIVCTTKDYKGDKFDLHKLIDYSTGFISKKSKDGKKLKAMELPGLWNGSMSDWNTIFVEVPAITFNPVKTVIDLIRPEHQ